jgi:hypothetical protein
MALALLAWCIEAAALIPASAAPAELSATQIVERNVAARGGLEAWRKIQTMVWVGHLEGARLPMPNTPFLLEQKRPNKTRFEIIAGGEKSMRVFDGSLGWKVRSGSDGRPVTQPFTPQELSFAQRAPGIDGALIDAQAKGNAVTLEGTDEVDGRAAYRLLVRLASGERDRVWIDAQTFLDVKVERTSYDATGAAVPVAVHYGDYKAIDGLQIPTTIETSAGPATPVNRMVIERISLNPPLSDRTFAKPGAPNMRFGMATPTTTGNAAPRPSR